jgi:hypothetical protein
MPSTIKLSITDHAHTVELTLNDPIGPNNSWSAGTSGVLSSDSGTWNQLTGAGDLNLHAPHETVLVIQGINTYAPSDGMPGSGIHFGSGGLIADNASIDATVVSFS